MAERVRDSVKSSGSGKEYQNSKVQKTDSSLGSHLDRILFLQRTISNRAIKKLIGFGTSQTNLNIGQPMDKYEQEADRVAAIPAKIVNACS